jgi:hypothetical protein
MFMYLLSWHELQSATHELCRARGNSLPKKVYTWPLTTTWPPVTTIRMCTPTTWGGLPLAHLLSSYNRLKFLDLCYFQSLLNGTLTDSLVLSHLFFYCPIRTLRRKQLFDLPKVRLCLQQRLLFWRVCHLANQVVEIDFAMSKGMFQNHLFKILAG